MNDFHPAADEIRALARGHLPRVGLVLGSGLETVVDSIDQSAAIAYDALPGFPIPSVEGHQGQLVLGEWNGVRIACLQGRAHAPGPGGTQFVRRSTRQALTALDGPRHLGSGIPAARHKQSRRIDRSSQQLFQDHYRAPILLEAGVL